MKDIVTSQPLRYSLIFIRVSVNVWCVCVCACLYVCVCLLCTDECSGSRCQKRVSNSPGAGATGCCKLPDVSVSSVN